jgi:hypothetical protein
MPYEPDPYNMAELLQALDDVREAAKRVDREQNLAAKRSEPAAAAAPAASAGEPHQREIVDDELAG